MPVSFLPDLLTVREYTMMGIMNSISDKIGWHAKVFDDDIKAKWKTEVLAQPNIDVSEKMFEEVSYFDTKFYLVSAEQRQCIAELKYKADVFKGENLVEALNGVFKSDTIIPEHLRLALIDAVKPLEDIQEDQKDWHPGSGGKVLDLVHPSLYPLVYGQTRLIPLENTTSVEDWRCQFDLGGVSEKQEGAGAGNPSRQIWSERFQWLPCNIDVSGNEPKIISYINNLHPGKHRKLYPIIEQIIQKSMALWDVTLSTVRDSPPRKPRIKLEGTGYGESDEPEPEYPTPDAENPDNEFDDDAWDEQYRAWQDNRPILQPEPHHFEPYIPLEDGTTVDLRADWGYPNRRLQVIVKLATIHLNPSSPTYDGGSWHVEGAANEAICASAIYYYQTANISESCLSFRQKVDDGSHDMQYEQSDHRAVETIYGFENDDACVQDLGKVRTSQGRLITFPNVMQHRVEPFSLEDRTKPGYRKILALFLVDPHQRIISTANVPPQQPEWWEEHLKMSDRALQQLPQELRDNVESHLTAAVSLEEAKRQRLELMDERSVHVEANNRDFDYGHTFSLCEH